MARNGVAALCLGVLLAAFEIGSCIQCHQCISTLDHSCGDPFHNVDPYGYNTGGRTIVDCERDSRSVSYFYTGSLGPFLPKEIIDRFPAGGPKYCAKFVSSNGIVARTCIESNPVDPRSVCNQIKYGNPNGGYGYSSYNQYNNVRECEVCDRDFCNGAGSIAASVPLALLALVACLYYKH